MASCWASPPLPHSLDRQISLTALLLTVVPADIISPHLLSVTVGKSEQRSPLRYNILEGTLKVWLTWSYIAIMARSLYWGPHQLLNMTANIISNSDWRLYACIFAIINNVNNKKISFYFHITWVIVLFLAVFLRHFMMKRTLSLMGCRTLSVSQLECVLSAGWFCFSFLLKT